MNHGFCNECRKLVPVEPTERDGKIYLVKNCPDCGPTDNVIAGDAERYHSKRSLDEGYDYRGCKLKCINCPTKNVPNIVFLDITNRCNMNCPICINNTPSMGFLFEPPLEYFDKVFKHFSTYDPVPSFQLFGGEPTVRDDLFEIIKMAQSYGIAPRVVTNGIKLADEEYCRKLVESRATILIAYDGANPKVYKVLRGVEKYLDLKQKALENIGKIKRAKTVLMSLVGKDFNDKDLPDLFDYVHERREFIRGIFFMPLAHTWKTEEFDLEPPRITSEDVEEAVDEAFPGDRVDFVPAAFLGQLPELSKHMGIKPLPFIGAHPNCESMYVMVSDGERYRPAGYYFKRPILEVCADFLKAEKKLEKKKRFKRLRAGLYSGWALLKNARIGRFFKGRGPFKLYHMLALPLSMAVGTRTKHAMARHTTVQGTLQLIILPFEDPSTLETDRMERCPSAFAYYNPEEDKVHNVPVCAWGLHKTNVMKMVTEHYGTTEPIKCPTE